MGLNRIFIMGNLTADPELKYLPKGTAVVQFNVACNRQWKDEAGNKKEECTFVGVKAWGKQAETISQYFKKGRPILVEGRLTQETWEKDGKKNSKTLVTLESFQFVGGDRDREQGGEAQAPAPRQTTQRTPVSAPTPAPVDDDSGDVPF